MNSFFRYPGGKSKLKKVISKHLSIYASENGLEYREPFFGGGSIGIEFLSMFSNRRRKIWINDKDSGIAALWTSVIRYPDLLKTMVIEFIPSVEAFYQYRDILTSINPSSDREMVRYGFMKLAVHQISYSGLGTKSGSPLGGKKQESKYKIDCRWSPKYICGKIDFLHRLLNGADVRGGQCTNLDFMDLIEDEGKAILYLDPPYQDTTSYKDSFDHEQFWDWCRNMYRYGHTVFVSEYNAPDDFTCIWETKITSSLTKNTGGKVGHERLFTLSGQKMLL